MRDNPSGAGNQQERLSEITADYIVGVVDGEGYFSVSPRIRSVRGREVIQVDCVFGIDLQEKDRPILEAIQHYFQCGKMYFREDRRERFCNLWAYRVRTHTDLLGKIVPFFEHHPLHFPSKRESFKRFRSVLEIIARYEHQNPGGFHAIQEIVAQGRILRD